MGSIIQVNIWWYNQLYLDCQIDWFHTINYCKISLWLLFISACMLQMIIYVLQTGLNVVPWNPQVLSPKVSPISLLCILMPRNHYINSHCLSVYYWPDSTYGSLYNKLHFLWYINQSYLWTLWTPLTLLDFIDTACRVRQIPAHPSLRACPVTPHATRHKASHTSGGDSCHPWTRPHQPSPGEWRATLG